MTTIMLSREWKMDESFILPAPIQMKLKPKVFSREQHPSFQYYAPMVMNQKRMLSNGILVNFTPIMIKPKVI